MGVPGLLLSFEREFYQVAANADFEIESPCLSITALHCIEEFDGSVTLLLCLGFTTEKLEIMV